MNSPKPKDTPATRKRPSDLVRDALNHHVSREAADIVMAAIAYGHQTEEFPDVAHLCESLGLRSDKDSPVWGRIAELAKKNLADYTSPHVHDINDVIVFPGAIQYMATNIMHSPETPYRAQADTFTFSRCTPGGEKTAALGKRRLPVNANAVAAVAKGNIPDMSPESHGRHGLDVVADLLRPVFPEDCITALLAVYGFHADMKMWPTLWQLCDGLGYPDDDALPLFVNIDMLQNMELMDVSCDYQYSDWGDEVSLPDDVTLLVSGLVAVTRSAA